MRSTNFSSPDWYWTETLNGEDCFLAVGFGLGPRVAGATLASQLNLQIHSWRPSWTFPAGKRYYSLFNFGVEAYPSIRTTGPKVLIDCLGWLRAEPLARQQSYNYILYESFFPTREHLLRSHRNACEIKPLVEFPRSTGQDLPYVNLSSSTGYCLASFGGIGTPYSTAIQSVKLPAALLRWLAAQRQHVGGAEILFCAPEPHCSAIRAELGANLSGVRFVSPCHREFLGLLESAVAYVVQPGLYGLFEGFLRGPRVILTPPMSYTQFKQAQALRGSGLVAEIPSASGLEAYLIDLGDSIAKDEPAFFDALNGWWFDCVSGAGVGRMLEGWGSYLATSAEGADFGSVRRERILQSWDAFPGAVDVLREEAASSRVPLKRRVACVS